MLEQFELQSDAINMKRLTSQRSRFAELLYNNDQAYFRAGAEIEEFEDWKIVRIAGFPELAAACVLEAPPGETIPPSQLLNRLSALNVSTIRFYQKESVSFATRTRQMLAETKEYAYLLNVEEQSLQRPNPDLFVRPIQHDEDALKIALYASREDSPDGKNSDPAEYVALERIKADAGYMQTFIIEDQGQPAACFGLSVTNQLVRMKNLLTGSHARGRGCGTAIVHHAIEFARSNDKSHVGVFAIDGGSGQRLYERCGMRRVGVQTEYSASLNMLAKEIGTCRT